MPLYPIATPNATIIEAERAKKRAAVTGTYQGREVLWLQGTIVEAASRQMLLPVNRSVAITGPIDMLEICPDEGPCQEWFGGRCRVEFFGSEQRQRAQGLVIGQRVRIALNGAGIPIAIEA